MGEKPVVVELFGLNFNVTNCLSGVIAAAIVFFLVFYLTRKVEMRPNKRQNVMEYLLDFTDSIVSQAVPGKEGKQFSLFALTMFLFVFMSNQLGLFLEITVDEHIWVKSPTASPLITMTLAAMSLMLSYQFAMRKYGVKGYLTNYAHPVGFLLPINIMEEFTNFLTLSLRLYGNIYAGEVLLTLIGGRLAKSFGLLTVIGAAPLAMVWQGFSVFIGAIQAYVFVTLSMVYISHKIEREA